MNLLIFGMGYTAAAVVAGVPPNTGGGVRGTTRSAQKAAHLTQSEIDARVFPGDDVRGDITWATHILITAGPEGGKDPVLTRLRPAFIDHAAQLMWVGYLSTTAVYGDHNGGWVDETTPPAPTTTRGQARLAAEQDWITLCHDHGLPVHIFRLPGIYGPGRGPFAKLRAGTARRIIKDGQVFNRIHVDDLAQALRASMATPNPGAIYNIADDVPAPPQDVIAYAATLLGRQPPPALEYDVAPMSPMARDFYAESKRVDNQRMKRELGVNLRYPDYRVGLHAVLAAEET